MDQEHLRQTAHQSIVRNGSPGLLRRPNLADRQCWVSVIDYKPIERIGKAINPTDRRALVSALTRVGTDTDGSVLSPPPAAQDLLVRLDRNGNEIDQLRLYAPVGRVQPSDIVLLWDLQVRAA